MVLTALLIKSYSKAIDRLLSRKHKTEAADNQEASRSDEKSIHDTYTSSIYTKAFNTLDSTYHGNITTAIAQLKSGYVVGSKYTENGGAQLKGDLKKFEE